MQIMGYNGAIAIALEMAEKIEKTERISVIIPSDLKQEFEKLCKLENRSMSNMAVTLIQQAVADAKEEGKIP